MAAAFSSESTIDRPAAEVWAALTRWEDAPEWMSGIDSMSADGPTEVHMTTIAKHVLKGVEPVEGLWPSEHLPERRAAARERFSHILEREIGNS